MMTHGHLRHLVRQTLGYGITMVLNRFAGVILVPIYTRVLSPADYGTWGPFSYWVERREGALHTYAKALTYYTRCCAHSPFRPC
jgi:hypothetical protein